MFNRTTFWAFVALALFSAATRFIWLDQLPPGLWFDEAWVSVAAAGSETPVYFPAYFGGMHPAVVYLTRLAQFFSGGHPLTIRYLLAVVTTLTVLGSVWAYSKFPPAADPTPFPYHFLAAFILSITYPFFHFSRLGYESLLPAPVALVTLALLAHFLRQPTPSWKPAVLLGLGCGLAIYSFGSGRFIPIALATVYWLYWLANTHRPSLRQALTYFALIVGVALLVAAPLLHFFWVNAEQFTTRPLVTSYYTLGPGADSVPLAILRNTGRTVGAFFLPGWGDELTRHNLPGRPIFDPFLAFLFFCGLLALAQKPRSLPTILFLSWLTVGLLPVVLTDGAPTYSRIFVAVPALSGIAAWGGQWLWHKAPGRWWATAGLVMGLLFSTFFTLRDYFVLWAEHPGLYNDFQVGVWQAAVLAQTRSHTEQIYIIPNTIDDNNPTLALLLAETNAQTHPAAPCLYVPHTTPTTYIVNHLEDKKMGDWLVQTVPTAQQIQQFINPFTTELQFTAFSTPAGFQATTTPPLATFQQAIELRQVAWTQEANLLHLTFWWSAASLPPADHTLFIHLYPAGAENSAPVAQIDTAPCWPTSQWQHNGWLYDETTLVLPAALPPGRYTAALGWYTYPTFERLTLTADHTLPDHRYPFAEITITP